MASNDLTAQVLREHLRYDPDTGIFIRVCANGTAKPGDVAGWVERNGYRKLSIIGSKFYAHRCAVLYMTGEWPPEDVDHIDGDRSNNRYGNLRCVSDQVNLQNMRRARRDNRTGFLGVRYHRASGKFMAEIKDSAGVRRYLGLHETAELAHEAYLAAKRELHEGCTI